MRHLKYFDESEFRNISLTRDEYIKFDKKRLCFSNHEYLKIKKTIEELYPGSIIDLVLDNYIIEVYSDHTYKGNDDKTICHIYKLPDDYYLVYMNIFLKNILNIGLIKNMRYFKCDDMGGLIMHIKDIIEARINFT